VDGIFLRVRFAVVDSARTDFECGPGVIQLDYSEVRYSVGAANGANHVCISRFSFQTHHLQSVQNVHLAKFVPQGEELGILIRSMLEMFRPKFTTVRQFLGYVFTPTSLLRTVSSVNQQIFIRSLLSPLGDIHERDIRCAPRHQ
jgi:hypothetical protein